MSLVPVVIPDAPPAPILPRRRQLLVGTALATASATVLVLTLLGHYVAARNAVVVPDGDSAWFDGITVPLTQPTMGLATLLMSSVTLQWAVWSISRDDRPNTYLALGVTGLLGLAFVNQMVFLFSDMGLVMGTNPEAPVFYAVSAAHLAMVIGGLIFGLISALRAFGGQFGSSRPDGISAVALHWHVTVLLFGVLWYAVYITK